MLGLKKLSLPPPILSVSRPKFTFPFFLLQTDIKIPKFQSRFLIFAQNDNNSGEPIEQKQEKLNGSTDNGTNGDDFKKNRPPLLNIKWGELLLDSDPDNILAVALTGLLTWASAQVLWQLFLVSAAILVAALKYSFIAALLIFILITLL